MGQLVMPERLEVVWWLTLESEESERFFPDTGGLPAGNLVGDSQNRDLGRVSASTQASCEMNFGNRRKT